MCPKTSLEDTVYTPENQQMTSCLHEINITIYSICFFKNNQTFFLCKYTSPRRHLIVAQSTPEDHDLNEIVSTLPVDVSIRFRNLLAIFRTSLNLHYLRMLSYKFQLFWPCFKYQQTFINS